MKKYLIISLLCLLSFNILSFGQDDRYAVEVDLGIGVLNSFDKAGLAKTCPGMVLPYAEIRYVFRKSGIDVGLNASLNGFDRYDADGRNYTFWSRNYMIVSDYSFYEAKRMRMFGGIGAGLASYDYGNNLKFGRGFCAMPRAGICFFSHLEVTLGYLIEDKANSNLNLRVGYIF